MYGLAVNLIMSVSGHPSIINEIGICILYKYLVLGNVVLNLMSLFTYNKKEESM